MGGGATHTADMDGGASGAHAAKKHEWKEAKERQRTAKRERRQLEKAKEREWRELETAFWSPAAF